MKAHIGVDASSGLVHAAGVTSGSAANLFGVTLRAQPINPANTRQPVVNISLADEPFDMAVFGSRILGHNFPIVVRDAPRFERDSRFSHAVLCSPLEGRSIQSF